METLSSCIETFRVSQTELSLEVRSSSEDVKFLNEKQTELGLLIASIADLAFNDQSGETYPHIRDPNPRHQISGNSSKPVPPVASVTKPAISDQSVETHPHVGSPDTGRQELYSPTATGQ